MKKLAVIALCLVCSLATTASFAQQRVFGYHIEAKLDLRVRGTTVRAITKDSVLSVNDSVTLVTAAAVAKKIRYLQDTMVLATYTDTSVVNFKKFKYQTLTLTDTVIFKSANLTVGREIKLRIVNSSGAIAGLTFPSGWIFVGTKPTVIASGKSALLVVISYGTSDANVIAFYQVQS